MKISFHAASLPADTSIDCALADAKSAGFDAIDLGFGATGELNCQSTESDCRRFRETADQQGISLSALWLRDPGQWRLATPRADDRRAIHHVITCALERAAWLGAGSVVVNTAPDGAAARSNASASYEERLHRITESFAELRFLAQRYAVTISCLAPAERFLLSPLEARRFIDEICSPWIAVCLDACSPVTQCRWPDWLIALGHRLERIFLPGAVPAPPHADLALPVHQAVLSAARGLRSITCRDKKSGANLQAELSAAFGASAN